MAPAISRAHRSAARASAPSTPLRGRRNAPAEAGPDTPGRHQVHRDACSPTSLASENEKPSSPLRRGIVRVILRSGVERLRGNVHDTSQRRSFIIGYALEQRNVPSGAATAPPPRLHPACFTHILICPALLTRMSMGEAARPR